MRDPLALTQCLVDGDPARVGGFRRLRCRALLFSIGIEALLLAALLLAPLASPETLLRHAAWTPIPPYSSMPNSPNRPPRPHDSSPNQNPHSVVQIFQPPTIPPPIPPPDASEEAGFSPAGQNFPPGVGSSDPCCGVPFGGGSSPIAAPPEPPKPPARPPRIIPRSEGATAALLEYRVVPVYPRVAILTRTQGEVRLRAIIATDGTIKSLEVESGNPMLIDAARSAVQQWRYQPALLSGQPVEVDTFIRVIFRLSP